MAFQTGTSANFIDLLNDLVTFATANGWVLEKSELETTNVEARYLRGPGSASEAPVHVNIRTGAVPLDGEFWWEVRAAASFDGAFTFSNQPSSSPDTYLLLADSTIDYWFMVSDRRIIVVAKISTSYFSMYAGFFLPFATPQEYPLPLYVGASRSTPTIFTTTNSGIRGIADPGINAAWLRNAAGTWERIYNHNDNTANDDSFLSHRSADYYTWPYYTGGGTSGTDDFPTIDIRPPPGDPDANLLIPVHIFGSNIGRGVLGLLEEVYWIPGFGVGAEQTFTIASRRATGTLTLTANLADGDTVTIGTRTYTFQDTLTDVDGNVHIGTTTQATLENLRDAINLGLGAGFDFAASTTVHPTVAAENPTASALTVVAKQGGPAGDTIATTETSTNASWAAATLQGGGSNDEFTIFPNVTRNSANHFFALKNV